MIEYMELSTQFKIASKVFISWFTKNTEREGVPVKKLVRRVWVINFI